MDRYICDFCGSTKRHADDCQPPEHGGSCSCLDCHAVRNAAPGSCRCSLCQDRYRSEIVFSRFVRRVLAEAR